MINTRERVTTCRMRRFFYEIFDTKANNFSRLSETLEKVRRFIDGSFKILENLRPGKSTVSKEIAGNGITLQIKYHRGEWVGGYLSRRFPNAIVTHQPTQEDIDREKEIELYFYCTSSKAISHACCSLTIAT